MKAFARLALLFLAFLGVAAAAPASPLPEAQRRDAEREYSFDRVPLHEALARVAQHAGCKLAGPVAELTTTVQLGYAKATPEGMLKILADAYDFDASTANGTIRIQTSLQREYDLTEIPPAVRASLLKQICEIAHPAEAIRPTTPTVETRGTKAMLTTSPRGHAAVSEYVSAILKRCAELGKAVTLTIASPNSPKPMIAEIKVTAGETTVWRSPDYATVEYDEVLPNGAGSIKQKTWTGTVIELSPANSETVNIFYWARTRVAASGAKTTPRFRDDQANGVIGPDGRMRSASGTKIVAAFH